MICILFCELDSSLQDVFDIVINRRQGVRITSARICQADGRDDDGCARGHFVQVSAHLLKSCTFCAAQTVRVMLMWIGVQLRFASSMPERLPMMSSLPSCLIRPSAEHLRFLCEHGQC